MRDEEKNDKVPYPKLTVASHMRALLRLPSSPIPLNGVGGRVVDISCMGSREGRLRSTVLTLRAHQHNNSYPPHLLWEPDGTAPPVPSGTALTSLLFPEGTASSRPNSTWLQKLETLDTDERSPAQLHALDFAATNIPSPNFVRGSVRY